MNVVVPKEIAPGERRVALTPEVAARVVKAGNTVIVEHGAGAAAGFSDADYQAAGAQIAPSAAEAYAKSGLTLKVQRPIVDGTDELALLPAGSALITFLAPLAHPEFAAKLAERKITGLSMELIPRISRAQSMDALSSQATVAGYEAVLLAAAALPKFFPMLMTAAGTVPPAKVLVLGAGVYAKELAADQQRRDQELIATTAAGMDVIITTALIPGRRAPLLITAAAVQNMRAGSVIVDLAAEAGGNCELSEPGSTVVKAGVTILAPLNVPAMMPQHASMLYAKNVFALVSHLVKDGALVLDMDDEITKGVCVTRDGQILNEAVRSRLQGVGA